MKPAVFPFLVCLWPAFHTRDELLVEQGIPSPREVLGTSLASFAAARGEPSPPTPAPHAMSLCGGTSVG